jgi:hypothetical protein
VTIANRSARSILVLALIATTLAVSPAASAAPGPDRSRGDGRPPPPEATTRQKTLPALAWAPRDGLTRARLAGVLSDAEYALLRAESIFRPAPLRARFGAIAPASRLDVTFVLRDLAVRVRLLDGDLRRRAERVLARPTDGGADPLGDGYTVAEETPFCSTNVCIHYVATTADAPDLTDVAPANGTPDYVDEASAVLEEVWTAEVTTAGYRAPLSDLTSTNNGGDAKLDVYLKDVGAIGLYGYCTSDDPNLDDISYLYWDYSAYCVVDDDFSAGQFPGTSGIDALKVTAAHELFHAVQFAYDIAEDLWFMEGTSTWMEEQVYDAIDDNRQYLPVSSLAVPSVPLDKGGAGLTKYGNWIFWQFLTEYFGDTSVISGAWVYADGSAAGLDYYSTQALAWAIDDFGIGGWQLRWTIADFGAWNAAPRVHYAEGAAGAYPAPQISESVTLSGTKLRMAESSFGLDHMTSRYIVVKRGKGISTTAKLRIVLDGPPWRTGTEATAVVFRSSGNIRVVPLRISKDGDSTRSVAFARGVVSKVVIVLTNASTRFKDCWTDPDYLWSCSGVSRDDDLAFSVSAQVV